MYLLAARTIPVQPFGSGADGWAPRIGKHLNRVRAGRQQH